MALWTPELITVDLWHDCADSYSAGLCVDKSGNAHHGVQATTSAQPTLVAAGLNGKNYESYDGGDYLSCGDVLDLGTGSLYIFVVGKFDSTADGAFIGKSIYATQTGGYSLCKITDLKGLFETPTVYSASYAYSSTAWAVFCLEINRQGGATRLYVNGSLVATTTFPAIATDFNTTTRLLIGAHSNSDDSGIQFYLTGAQAERLIIRRQLSPLFRERVEGYLAHKWGLESLLPATHTYKSAAPEIFSYSNRVKINPTDVPSLLQNISLPIHLNNACGTGSYDASQIFNDLDPYDQYWDNVVLAMPMDGPNNGTAFVDLTGKTITRYGDAKISTAQFKFNGSSAYFDGSGDYLQYGVSSNFDMGSSDFTVELYVRPSSDPDLSGNALVTCGSATSNRPFGIYQTSNAFSFWFQNTLGTYLTATWSWSTSPANTWVHLAGVRSGDNILLFVDGILRSTTAITGSANSYSTGLYIGKIAWNVASDFTGYIDDLRITKGVARYTADFAPPPIPLYKTVPPIPTDPYAANVVLALPCAGSFVDLTGKTVTVAGNAAISTAQFKFNGSSAYFDGGGDYVTYAHNSSFNLDSGDFTIEFWFYGSARLNRLISKRSVANGRTWLVAITPGTSVSFSFWTTDNIYNPIGGPAPAVNAWNHIACVRHGNDYIVFVNGVAGTTVTTSLRPGTNTDILCIGLDPSSTSVENTLGYTSDIRIYSGVAKYTSNFTPPTRSFYAPPFDPYWSSVALYMPMCLPAFADYKGKAVTVSGNATISTAQSVFRGSSAYFDGSGDYLSIASSTSLDFGTGSFTIEGCINLLNNTDNIYYRIVARGGYQSGTGDWYIAINPSNKEFSFACGDSSTFQIALATVTSEFVAGTWDHFAVVREGATVTLYVNGVNVGSNTSISASLTNTRALTIGTNYNLGEYFKGYISDLRITKGVARYTENFIPEPISHTYGGLNPMAKRIALERGDDFEFPLGIAPLDWKDDESVIYGQFETLEETDEFHLAWDSAGPDNPNVVELFTAPSAPSSGDALTVWNLAASDSLWLFTSESGTILVKKLLAIQYLLEGSLKVPFEEVYGFTVAQRGELVELYGLAILSSLTQYYTDFPALRVVLEQYFGDAAQIVKRNEQVYEDALLISNYIRQHYSLNAALIARLDQLNAIAAGIVGSSSEWVYELKYTETLKTILTGIYSIFAESIVVDDTVTVSISGRSVRFISANIRYSQSSYIARGSVKLAYYDDWVTVREKDAVVININGTDHNLVALSATKSETHTKLELSIEVTSPAVLLDFPYAKEIPSNFAVSGTMSQIVNNLAALEGMSIVWEIPVDDVLTSNEVKTEGASPLSVIKSIVNDLGGILQSHPDGSIHAVQSYKVDSDKYSTVVPIMTFSLGQDFVSIEEEIDKRDGYNKYSVTNASTNQGWRLLTPEQLSASSYKIKAVRVPWSNAIPELYTSELTNVTISSRMGPVLEEIEEEVEIVNGVGNVAEACYSVVSTNYKTSTNLGNVSISEDGAVTTQVSGNTLVTVKYMTKYWAWTVSNPDKENVQFILEAE